MKLHRHLVYATLNAVREIFEEEKYADRVIEFHLKQNKKWGSRDRRFFAESVYDIVRWWRYLHHFLVSSENEKFSEKHLLDVFAVWYSKKHQALPPWPEFEHFLKRTVPNQPLTRAIEESVPDWLDALGEEELGVEKWGQVLKSLNRPAQVVLRTNTLLLTREQLAYELLQEDVETLFVEGVKDALVLKERKNVFITNCFKNGFFEVQDAASQQIAPLLQILPGMRVVDVCAGAGGKSLHIASLLENKGKVISLDIYERKLKELKRRARRAHVDVIETRLIESTKVIKRMKESADRLLLDVPCSGMGVLRRNPDSKWKLTPQKIKDVNQLQLRLIQDYSSILKPNGIMVYATCSVLPKENERVVESFMTSQKSWDLLEQRRWWPDEDGYDGFYAAVLKKNE